MVPDLFIPEDQTSANADPGINKSGTIFPQIDDFESDSTEILLKFYYTFRY